MELGRRVDGTQLHALTTPLLTTSSGVKMGKTMSGAVWLNADMLSPYDYWQFWRNSEDADVGRFLKLYTELPLDEIARLAALGGSEINDAKKILATEATTMLHGREAAAQAAETARRTFEEGQSAEGLPTISLDLDGGAGVLAACVAAGFASSNGEARRSIQGGAIKLNDVAVSDDKLRLTREMLSADGTIKLSMGKKKHVLIKPV
jgi:tyrosyl-tRNA synthetase